jgi:hypothetical protein
VCFFDVAARPSSLKCSKWWKRFRDMFNFFGPLPQGIVCRFRWCKTLQECLDAIVFVPIEELFEFLGCCVKYWVPISAESPFSLIIIGQSYILSASVCSGVAFQPAHCAVQLKDLTAASMSSSVLRGTFRVNL